MEAYECKLNTQPTIIFELLFLSTKHIFMLTKCDGAEHPLQTRGDFVNVTEIVT